VRKSLTTSRILLVANYRPDGQESMQRYAYWLAQALEQRGIAAEVIRPKVWVNHLSVHGLVWKYLGYIDKYLIFPSFLRRRARQFDLVHILDHSNSMYLSTVAHLPNLITCHDLLAIRAARGEFAARPVKPLGRVLQSWILKGLCRAPHILAVSSKTKEDLRLIAHKSDGQCTAILSPMNWAFSPAREAVEVLPAALRDCDQRPYVLHLSGGQWYKNQPGVLRLFAALNQQYTARYGFSLRLLMAGKPISQPIRDLAEKLGITDCMVELLSPSNEQLQAIYSNAFALLFPSLQEGFGWPILEAQACGCPVITSNREPMTEIGGSAALYVDPLQPELNAGELLDSLADREALSKAGFINLKRFDEQLALEGYCALYEKILAE